MHAGGGPEEFYAEEFPIARLCDSGLPDPEVCDVLHVPPREAKVVSEAWSRGCAQPTMGTINFGMHPHACMHACHMAPTPARLLVLRVSLCVALVVDACVPQKSKPTHCAAAAGCTHMAPSMMCRRWLLGLLVLQSTSSMVLDLYQDLLRNHLVVTLFLTMLVGAGGNAGNQSAIKVIRGLVRTLASNVKKGTD